VTITPWELALYAGAVFVLFLTPGPVWVALVARAVSGGFQAAWPLALGVVIGDAIWPAFAVLGLAWVVAAWDGALDLLRYLAAAVFLIMGALLIRHADRDLASDSRLTRPGMWAGFVAGLAVILGNPKAILFYMGVLPGFFDLSRVTTGDLLAIMGVSMLVPLLGNLALGLLVGRVRRLLASPGALRRTNLVAGGLLVGVGVVIPLT